MSQGALELLADSARLAARSGGDPEDSDAPKLLSIAVLTSFRQGKQTGFSQPDVPYMLAILWA